MMYCYARVSTDGQSVDAQVKALRAAGAEKIFRETASGAKTDRAQLRRAIAALGEGDTLLVARLDRLARSTRDLLNTLAQIADKGAGFRSLADAWADTTTAHGRLMLTAPGGLAEFERDLIRNRTTEGRERAKANGVKMGRPPKLTPHQKKEAIKRRDHGEETLAEIGKSYKVSGWTIARLAHLKGGIMTEQESAARTLAESQPMTFANFLEDMHPSQLIEGVVQVWGVEHGNYGKREFIRHPDLRLHCDNEHCRGITFFRFSNGDTGFNSAKANVFITYQCSNCQQNTKMFSLHLRKKPDSAADCYKFGENPPYGVPTPTRLLRLFEKEREIYLKGRRCEYQGLGIGAFVYYRRVVEHQKNKILDEIIKVASKLNVDPSMLDALTKAKAEVQFSKAMESLKDAIPQVLLINGHNPLTLLHSALSQGLHNESDAECLDLAHTIRVVLSELAERLGQALKNEAELNTAISRLMQKRPET